jgi:1-acyl-sn-glycerol-3-phosphate acyltransferase
MLLMTLPLVPVQMVALLFNARLADRLPRLYFDWTRRIFGIGVDVGGCLSRDRPALFVSNHTSYLDIIVLGSVIEGSFISKAEVRDWPLIGLLCRLCKTVFIDRRRHNVGRHRTEISDRLNRGARLILFPEGTSTGGNRTRSFKSALLSVAEEHPGGRPLTVQPVSVAYVRLDGLPLGRALRPLLAWYGVMPFFSHFWRTVGFGSVTVSVTFHEPVTIDQFPDRKALAAHCERVVAAGLSAALAGRTPALVKAA